MRFPFRASRIFSLGMGHGAKDFDAHGLCLSAESAEEGEQMGLVGWDCLRVAVERLELWNLKSPLLPTPGRRGAPVIFLI